MSKEEMFRDLQGLLSEDDMNEDVRSKCEQICEQGVPNDTRQFARDTLGCCKSRVLSVDVDEDGVSDETLCDVNKIREYLTPKSENEDDEDLDEDPEEDFDTDNDL